jgi:predicted transcriptional regulator
MVNSPCFPRPPSAPAKLTREQLAALRADIRAGLAQAERGELLDGQPSLARVRAALAARDIRLDRP